MKENWDELFRQELKKEVEAVSWEEHKENQILDTVHSTLKERKKIMKLSTRAKVILVAATFVVVGSITAVAAGKVSVLYSSINKNDAIVSQEELEKQAGKKMGEGITISAELSDGSRFEEGYVTEVEGRDEEGDSVATYPNVYAVYGDVSLNISKGISDEEKETADRIENYKGFDISASSDHYLFLPPNQEPSEEDKALEEAGDLYISYGTDQEERKVYVWASWFVGDVRYSLSTFAEETPEEIMDMAKAYIDEIVN